MEEKNKKITEIKPARPRFVWFEMQWLKLRESRTHKHHKNCFFKKKAVVKLFLLSFLPMRKKESLS